MSEQNGRRERERRHSLAGGEFDPKIVVIRSWRECGQRLPGTGPTMPGVGTRDLVRRYATGSLEGVIRFDKCESRLKY
jgi:hypothetical protein